MRSGWATPFVWRHALRTEIVTVGPGTAVSYDLAGKELWRLSGMSVAPIPMPFAYEVFSISMVGVECPSLRFGREATGDISLGQAQDSNAYVAWSQARAEPYLPSPVAYEGGIYVLTENGILNRFDAKTGKLAYKERIASSASAFTTSPWAYNGKISA